MQHLKENLIYRQCRLSTFEGKVPLLSFKLNVQKEKHPKTSDTFWKSKWIFAMAYLVSLTDFLFSLLLQGLRYRDYKVFLVAPVWAIGGPIKNLSCLCSLFSRVPAIYVSVNNHLAAVGVLHGASLFHYTEAPAWRMMPDQTVICIFQTSHLLGVKTVFHS